MFPWIILAITIVLEVCGSTLMKLANGFTVFWPSVGVFVCYGGSLVGLTLVLKYIDLSIAYAIWAGVGTALVATIGIVWFREPATALKIVSLVFVVIGVVGLQLASGHKAA